MKDFEENIKNLEESVQKLEKGGLALSDSLEVFEEGVKHYKKCLKELEDVKGRVEVLVENPDGAETKEFSAES